MKQKISGKPTAYILGEKDFYGRAFAVDAAVLIPRPETEELVEQVLVETQYIASLRGTKHIVDLGTGSGCIGVTLAAELKTEALTMVDVSREALAIAEKNATTHLSGMVAQLTHGDFTAPDFSLPQKADLIVSNPPYVFAEEHVDLDRSVRDFEPRLALVAENFTELHQRLIANAHANLVAGGLFALETHPQKSGEVADWLTRQGFVSVEIRNDFAGRPHFVFGRKHT